MFVSENLYVLFLQHSPNAFHCFQSQAHSSALELYIYVFIYLTSYFLLTSFHAIFFSLPLAMHSFFWKNILYLISKQVGFMYMGPDDWQHHLMGFVDPLIWLSENWEGDTFRPKSRKWHPTSMNMSHVANSCLLCWKRIWKRIFYFLASSK